MAVVTPLPAPSAAPAAQAAPPTAPQTPPAGYQALGTEPFWSVQVMPGQMRYSSPEEPKGIAFAYSQSAAGKAVTFTGTLNSKPAALTIEPGQCSDGMSDTVYPFKARFTWGGKPLQGCARPT